MKRTNSMQFEIAADGKSVHISRQYAAPLRQVWKAWTEASILDEWWAPEPWICSTRRMEFREGGEWLYSMNGPEGEKIWSHCAYGEIEPQSYFEATDNFCDEDGEPTGDMPSMNWRTEFSENEMGTRVENYIRAKAAEDLSKLVDMGFKQGFEMCQNNLENWLENNKRTEKQTTKNTNK